MWYASIKQGFPWLHGQRQLYTVRMWGYPHITVSMWKSKTLQPCWRQAVASKYVRLISQWPSKDSHVAASNLSLWALGLQDGSHHQGNVIKIFVFSHLPFHCAPFPTEQSEGTPLIQSQPETALSPGINNIQDPKHKQSNQSLPNCLTFSTPKSGQAYVLPCF